MSRKDVEAEITLEEAALLPGGRATLRFRTTAREAVKIRGAHARFTGFEESTAVYTTSNGKTTTTHTARERLPFVEERRTFQGREPGGALHNLKDGILTLVGGGDHEELAQGSRDVLLEVQLPERLPNSFEAKKAQIGYEAEIHLDIPAGRDFRHRVVFDVRSEERMEDAPERPFLTEYPEDTGRGFFDSMFGPDVAIRLQVESTVVVRGGRLRGQIEVRFPDSAKRVTAIECKLLRKESSEAHGHQDRAVEPIVTHEIPQRPVESDNLFASFDMPVPIDMIPCVSGQKFALTHELAVSLDVPWAKDPTVRIPIEVL